MSPEATPDIERLIDEIYAGGGYASRNDVLVAALSLLRERSSEEAAPLPARKKSARRRKWAISAWALQFLTTAVAVVACAAEVESIVATGPALTFIGLAFVTLTRPVCAARLFAYGVSAPFVCAFCAALIVLFEWGPGEAAVPILVVLSIYALVSLPAALLVLPELLRWQPAPAPGGPFSWQFSLRSLLAVTTAFCVLITITRLMFANSSRGEPFVFGIFVAVTLSLTVILLFVFIVDRRKRVISAETKLAVASPHAELAQTNICDHPSNYPVFTKELGHEL
jgi:hypothetical protein